MKDITLLWVQVLQVQILPSRPSNLLFSALFHFASRSLRWLRKKTIRQLPLAD